MIWPGLYHEEPRWMFQGYDCVKNKFRGRSNGGETTKIKKTRLNKLTKSGFDFIFYELVRPFLYFDRKVTSTAVFRLYFYVQDTGTFFSNNFFVYEILKFQFSEKNIFKHQI